MSLSIDYLKSSVTKNTIHSTLTAGIKSVWEEDEEQQEMFIKFILQEIRNNHGTDLDLTYQYLKDLGAFYVPNDEYLEHHFGTEIKKFEYGLYNGGLCKIYQSLAIPLRYLDGKVIGFVAYDNGNDSSDPDNFIKYQYPAKHVWDKKRYMFIERDELAKAIKDGYIFIVDGIFDKIRLQTLGYNATSLCGSSLTEWHELYLKPIKHKIVLPDNDKAGTSLSKWCQRRLDNCIEFKQGDEWDIDDWLKTDEGKEIFNCLYEESKSEGFIMSKVSRSLTAIGKRNEDDN